MDLDENGPRASGGCFHVTRFLEIFGDDSMIPLVTCPNWLEIRNFNCLGKAFQKTPSQEFTMFVLHLCASTASFSMQFVFKI